MLAKFIGEFDHSIDRVHVPKRVISDFQRGLSRWTSNDRR